jgi:hypothetical protein
MFTATATEFSIDYRAGRTISSHNQRTLFPQRREASHKNPFMRIAAAPQRSQWLQPVVRRFTATASNCKRTIKNNVSIVVTSIFPDASASAAGVRTRTLLQQMASKLSSHVCLTTANESDLMSTMATALRSQISNFSIAHLPRNRSQAIHKFIQQQQQQQQQRSTIQRVLWDRFYVEEAYSHAFMEASEQSSMILDMQDMHSLRWGRQELVQSLEQQYTNEPDPLKLALPQVLDFVVPSGNDQLLRELASIHRSDLTLVCSPYELDLLTTRYQIPSEKLCLASFFVAPSDIVLPEFTDKQEEKKIATETKFVFCGGFQHAPNVDAVRILLQHIWPRMQKHLPRNHKMASLHIHGAFCPNEFNQAHNPSQGIHVHGYTPKLSDVFDNTSSKNILLAPLRYGAGIKGKILDAWMHGMPVITTPIGSEGIVMNHSHDQDRFGGAICSSMDDFCEQAIAMMTSGSNYYQQAQQRGHRLLRE